jgi:hypothetical protein
MCFCRAASTAALSAGTPGWLVLPALKCTYLALDRRQELEQEPPQLHRIIDRPMHRPGTGIGI